MGCARFHNLTQPKKDKYFTSICTESQKHSQMQISIVTQEDLQEFKEAIIASLELMKDELLENSSRTSEVELLKSHQVQRMLGISPGTLQNMRVNGTIPFSKVGGVIFYDKQDILNIIDDNKQNV